VAALTMGHIQQRDGRWCIVDLLGKHGRVRTIPMPTWVKVAIDAWTSAAGVCEGPVFRSMNRGDQAQAAQLLDSFATLRPSEGVVYWFGIETPEIAMVTSLIIPDADTANGCVRTSAEANAAAITLTVDTALVYLGQAHSHPGSFVSHSATDDSDTFARFDGAISVVVPWFGRYGFHLEEWGVYRHTGGRFRSVADVEGHLRMIPGVVDLRSRNGGG